MLMLSSKFKYRLTFLIHSMTFYLGKLGWPWQPINQRYQGAQNFKASLCRLAQVRVFLPAPKVRFQKDS